MGKRSASSKGLAKLDAMIEAEERTIEEAQKRIAWMRAVGRALYDETKPTEAAEKPKRGRPRKPAVAEEPPTL